MVVYTANGNGRTSHRPDNATDIFVNAGNIVVTDSWSVVFDVECQVDIEFC